MLPPHWHPNAVNFVVAVLGNTTTYMYQENGARLVTEVLTPGHATIFPRASMHMMMNTGAFVRSLSLLFLPFTPSPSQHVTCCTNATLHLSKTSDPVQPLNPRIHRPFH
jgi:oxalate decarboxylase/phosphoglucose isomerase-like protein (cupin superfamily)